jgi:hypothetical protein
MEMWKKILIWEIFRWQSFQIEVAESAYCWDLATVEDIFGLENIR